MTLEEFEDLAVYRSILALDGTLPEAAFFRKMALPVYAVDGAANTLVKRGIAPELILGDLDSVEPELLQQYKNLKLPCQSQSDFEKALQYLQEQALMPAIIVGMNGGYIDHIINNLNIFLASGSIFYDPPLVGYALKANAIRQWTLALETKISIFGFPSARLSSTGLKWQLDNEELSFPGKNSSLNRSVESAVSIEVHAGSALVCIYLEAISDAGCRTCI